MENYSLGLTVSEINLIIEALGELPAKKTFNLIVNINNQVNKQNDPSKNYTRKLTCQKTSNDKDEKAN